MHQNTGILSNCHLDVKEICMHLPFSVRWDWTGSTVLRSRKKKKTKSINTTPLNDKIRKAYSQLSFFARIPITGGITPFADDTTNP
jgi:hypothetical protein